MEVPLRQDSRGPALGTSPKITIFVSGESASNSLMVTFNPSTHSCLRESLITHREFSASMMIAGVPGVDGTEELGPPEMSARVPGPAS